MLVIELKNRCLPFFSLVTRKLINTYFNNAILFICWWVWIHLQQCERITWYFRLSSSDNRLGCAVQITSTIIECAFSLQTTATVSTRLCCIWIVPRTNFAHHQVAECSGRQQCKNEYQTKRGNPVFLTVRYGFLFRTLRYSCWYYLSLISWMKLWLRLFFKCTSIWAKNSWISDCLWFAFPQWWRIGSFCYYLRERNVESAWDHVRQWQYRPSTRIGNKAHRISVRGSLKSCSVLMYE